MSDDNTQLSARDEVDLALLEAVDQDLGRTALEIWTEILGDIETMQASRIEPGYANHIVSRWPKLGYGDVPVFYELFHELLKEYREVLAEIVRLHPDALKNIAPVGDEESDAIANRKVYEELMFQWNLQTAIIEKRWDATDPNAGALIAAMAESQAFVTGGTGLMQALAAPQVGFTWTDEDQTALTERVTQAVSEL